MLRDSFLSQPALNTQDDVLENVALHNVLEPIKLLAGDQVLTQVLIIKVFLVISHMWRRSIVVDAVFHVGGIVTQLGSFAFTPRSRPFSSLCANLPLKVLGIVRDRPEDDYHNDQRVQAGEDGIPTDACAGEHEKVRDNHDEVEGEVVTLDAHVLVQLIVEDRGKLLYICLLVGEKVLLVV